MEKKLLDIWLDLNNRKIYLESLKEEGEEKIEFTRRVCLFFSENIPFLMEASLKISEEENKKTLAELIRNISYEIKVFLFTHSIRCSSYGARCECNNHKNIKIVACIFMSVIDV